MLQTAAYVQEAVFFQASFLRGGGRFPRSKRTISPRPQTAAKFCALNLFFGREMNYKIYHKNFLLMDSKHRELFVTKQSKWCRLMPKMQQNTFGARAPPGPSAGAPSTL